MDAIELKKIRPNKLINLIKTVNRNTCYLYSYIFNLKSLYLLLDMRIQNT